MTASFESPEHFLRVMEDVRNLTREELYALVAGGHGRWSELVDAVGHTAFVLARFSHELHEEQPGDEEDRLPSTDPAERDRRYWAEENRKRREAFHRRI